MSGLQRQQAIHSFVGIVTPFLRRATERQNTRMALRRHRKRGNRSSNTGQNQRTVRLLCIYYMLYNILKRKNGTTN